MRYVLAGREAKKRVKLSLVAGEVQLPRRRPELDEQTAQTLSLAASLGLAVHAAHPRGVGFACGARKNKMVYRPDNAPSLPLQECAEEECVCGYVIVPPKNTARRDAFLIYLLPLVFVLFVMNISVLFFASTEAAKFSVLASCCGAAGAVIRSFTSLPSIHDESWTMIQYQVVYLAQVIAGAIIGVMSYFAVESKILTKLFYGGVTIEAVTTWHGVALAAALAGLLTKEVVGQLSSRINLPQPDASNGETRSR